MPEMRRAGILEPVLIFPHPDGAAGGNLRLMLQSPWLLYGVWMTYEAHRVEVSKVRE